MMRGPSLIIAALLAACSPEPADPLGDAIHRADVVKKCADGTLLGRDPRTGRYVFLLVGFASVQRGWVAAGVKPEEFCK